MFKGWEKLLFRIQSELGIQRLRRDAEELRRLRLVPARGAERAFDRLAFGFGERHRCQVGRLFDQCGQALLLKIFRLKLRACSQHRQAFHGIA